MIEHGHLSLASVGPRALAPRLDRRIRRLLGHVFSFEVAFALFLFAGRFKADPRLDWVPVDLTAAFFALSVAAGSWSLLRRRFVLPRSALPAVGLMLLFTTWVVLSLVWSASQVYAQEKALQFALLNGWALAGAALIVGPSKERRTRLLTVIVLFATYMAIEGIVAYAQLGAGRFLTPLGGHYIGLGRTLGIATSITVCWALARDGSRRRWRLVALLLTAIFTFVIMTGGARGPLVATTLSLVPIGWWGLRARPDLIVTLRRYLARFLLLGLAAVAAGGVLLVLTDGEAQTLRRLTSLWTQEGGGTSATGRIQAYAAAVEGWVEAPLVGHGIGSFPILYGRDDVRTYPHNLFLEALVELGLAGTLVLLAVLTAPAIGFARRWRGWKDSLHHVALMALALNAFLNAQVSGDFNDNRLLFMAVGLLAGAHTRAED